MKTKHYLISTLLIISFFDAKAQRVYESIDVNNISAPILPDGLSFWNFQFPPNMKAFEVPINSGNYTILTSSLWIGGYDSDGLLRVAAETFRQGGQDFRAGPIDTLAGSAVDPSLWQKVWKVNLDEIEQHKLNWNSQGYSVPASIKDWPGNEPSSMGGRKLAPFVDINNNGIYEPEQGDYPDIKGDQALFIVFNDLHPRDRYTKGYPLGVEVHALVYGYKSSDDINNTIFINYKIHNHSGLQLDSLFIGKWTDFDLGYAYDDFIGSDSLRNMYFAYNNNDSDLAYGISPPAQGVVFLNHKLNNTMYYNNDFSFRGNPNHPVEFYHYLTGRFRDGAIYNEFGDTTKFALAGNPCTQTGNTETEFGFRGGDRRMIGSIGPLTLAVGEFAEVDIAYVYARSQNGHLESVCDLYSAVDKVKEFYEHRILTSNRKSQSHNVPYFRIFPNPGNGIFNLDHSMKGGTIYVFDASGRMLKSKVITAGENSLTLDLSDLFPGFYYVQLQGENSVQAKKLIIAAKK